MTQASFPRFAFSLSFSLSFSSFTDLLFDVCAVSLRSRSEAANRKKDDYLTAASSPCTHSIHKMWVQTNGRPNDPSDDPHVVCISVQTQSGCVPAFKAQTSSSSLKSAHALGEAFGDAFASSSFGGASKGVDADIKNVDMLDSVCASSGCTAIPSLAGSSRW